MIGPDGSARPIGDPYLGYRCGAKMPFNLKSIDEKDKEKGIEGTKKGEKAHFKIDEALFDLYGFIWNSKNTKKENKE